MYCPNPVNAPRAVKVKAVHRHVLCSHYDSCLNQTISSNWQGFSCKRCNAFKDSEWTDERWAEDSERCLALLGAALFPDLYDYAMAH